MTLQEADNAIASWNAGLGTAAQNLVDLQSLPVYMRLAGTNGVPKAQLTGETAAAVAPALTTISRLLLYFDLVQHMVIRCEELRRDMPMFGADQRLREIERMFTTASIQLPQEPVPLDRRSLLSSVENVECIPPSALVDLMTKAFDQVKGVVLRVDTAWETLGRQIEDTLARIEVLRPDSDPSGLAELDSATRIIADARARAESDPLAASSNFQVNVEPILTRVRTRVEETRKLRSEIDVGLAAARATFDSLLVIHQETLTAHAEVLDKIELPAPPPAAANEATITALKDWLQRLQSRFREGTLAPIVTGLRNWNKAVDDCVSSERRVLLANRAQLDFRAELRGRMDALKAKARARGVAESDRLSDLAENARDLLYTRPAPLDRAAAAVEAYEKHLNSKV